MTSETFDCPNCGQLAVTTGEYCPSLAMPDALPGHTTAHTHSRIHLHTSYVRGCATCRGALECSNCGGTYRESDHVIEDREPGLCPRCAVGG
ncbi:MAG TPA: hypothetical protein VGS01_09660 [Candidatus Limnocylindria bacterium]|jgi:hypothetical protein|nr:hypothetical protein [Candidatus Limnocylindria bacterium]